MSDWSRSVLLRMRDARIPMTAARIEAPRTLVEAADLMRQASDREERVLICGGGTEMSMGYAAEFADLLLRTTLLDSIVDHAPADLVVEVEAGTTLAALQAALAPHNQRLALDPPEPERATIGGLLAANTFGPRRARFGSLRDLIVGVSLIRADGERVRGGGKVVKNVAGFDLPKIAVGSLGTLGLIATATFRLHPVPQTTQALRVSPCDAAGVRALTVALGREQLEPAAVIADYSYEDACYAVTVVFEGFERGVDEQIERCAAIAKTLGASSTAVDSGGAFARDRAVRTHGDLRLRAALPPAAFAKLHDAVVVPFARGVARPQAIAYPTLGTGFFGGFADDEDAVVEQILAMRRGCESIGGNLVTLRVEPRSLAERIDPYGTLPSAFPLMRRLKDRFDPGHRINSGRFIGKI